MIVIILWNLHLLPLSPGALANSPPYLGLSRALSECILYLFYNTLTWLMSYCSILHVLSQYSLKLHLTMSSLLSLFLKLHLEQSFLPSACNSSTLISIQGYPASLASRDDALLHLDPTSFFIENPVDIRLYHTSRTYHSTFRTHTVSSLYVTLTVPVSIILQIEPSTILAIPSFFTIKELDNYCNAPIPRIRRRHCDVYT